MIKYLPHHLIDKEKWDDCISKAHNGSVYAYSWFLDITSPKKWDGVVEIGTKDDGTTSYLSVFPMEYRRILFFKYVYQSPFVQDLQVFSKHADNDVQPFVQKAIDRYSYIAKLRFSPDVKIDQVNKKLRTYFLPLNLPYESIKERYNLSRKRAIVKARRNGVKILENEGIDDLLILHKQEILPKFEYPLIKSHYKTMESLFKMAIQKNRVEIVNAVLDNEILASAAFFINQNKVFYYFAASNKHGRKYGASSLIVDHIIKKYSGKKMVLDFVGSDNENLAYFKKSLGSIEKFYQEIQINNLPFPIKFVQSLKQKIFYSGLSKKRYN